MRRAFLIILLLLLCYAYAPPRWADWSQTSRLALVRAIVEERTVRIDRFVHTTGDYALIDGHAYSDKAPGPALLAVPAYAAIRALTHAAPVQVALERVANGGALAATTRPDGAGLGVDRVTLALSHYLLTLLVIALPVVLGLVAFDWLLRRWFRPGPALLGTLGVGIATPLAPYAANFYSHALVAALLVGAWALIERTHESPVRQSWRLIPAGALLGLAVISEYPAALIAALLGLYALWRIGLRAALWIALGALPPLVLLIGYDLIAFGTPLPIGYAHSALWQEQHHSGFMSLTYPRLAAMWGLLGGAYRGLFARAPWLLLALPGAVLWWRGGRTRAPLAVAVAAAVSLWLLYSASRMWWGGFAAGPRYLVPAVPFAAIPAVWLVDRVWSRAFSRRVVIGIVAISAVLVWAEALAGQQFPPDTLANPWLGWTLPAWSHGDVARNLGMALGMPGAWSVLPLILGMAILLIVVSHGDRPITLRRHGPAVAARS